MHFTAFQREEMLNKINVANATNLYALQTYRIGKNPFTPIVLTIKILDLLLTNLVCDASAIGI